MLSAAAVPATTRARTIRLVRIDLSLPGAHAPSIEVSRTGTVASMEPAGNDPSVPIDAMEAVRSGQCEVN